MATKWIPDRCDSFFKGIYRGYTNDREHWLIDILTRKEREALIAEK
jgi:hypothetical protein